MTPSNPQIRTAEEFYYFCQKNPDHRFERESDGHIIEIPLSGGVVGRLNAQITADLSIWNETAVPGLVFASSTAFHLPDNSVRLTNATWISRKRWDALTEREQDRIDARKFPPICPDFVIELLRSDARSSSDSLNATKTKMTDVWMANGCRLAG